jgi:flagellar motor protein MotB
MPNPRTAARNRVRRASAAIVAGGVPATDVVVTSNGESGPQVPNETPQHRRRNRRIEVRVTR